MSEPAAASGWTDPNRVDDYLDRIGRLAPRVAGEAIMAEVLPATTRRVLDLGCGDGRLSALVLDACPDVTEVVAVDISPPMRAHAQERFADEPRVEVRDWNLADPIDDLGAFDVVVSGLAIHHVSDARKQELFGEISRQLNPGGVFANLEVVASPTPALHAAFRRALGREDDDPEDQLAPVEAQLGWMRDAGMVEVDCLWKWRGLALLVGASPA